MIDFNALFKVTYGLYIVCSGDKNYGNGFISNTFFQVTAEPAKFASCCSKNNHTAEIIIKYGVFTVSVLEQNASAEIIGRFGYKSGKDFNKMEGMNFQYGISGAPIIINESIAYLECKVLEKIDMGSHWLFIGELMEAKILSDTQEALTYSYYRANRKGVAPKNAPTYIDKSKLEEKKAMTNKENYKCSACGYIYEESQEQIPFADLPDDWKCPLCGADKEDFIQL